MAYNIPKFLKRDGDSLLFSGPSEDSYMAFYVPDIYFKRNCAVIMGEYVNLLGILDYAVFNTPNDKPKLKPFRFPTIFLTRPSSIETVKNLKLTETQEPDAYRILKFKNNDQVVVSTKVPQSINNVEEFYKLLITGKLPTTIRYDQFQNYFVESMGLNGNSYNISLQLFGIFVSEICRNNKNEPFRYTKDMKDMTAYKTISIKELPKLVSPFVSITSENWDESLVAAMSIKNPKNSPMEKLLMD